jgi:hypothetical protein
MKQISPIALALVLSACGGGGGGSASQGTLNLGITDGPPMLDGEHVDVVIEFNGVEVKPADGAAEQIDFSEPRTITISNYQGDERTFLLDGVLLDAGRYNWVRLKMNAEEQTLDSKIVFKNGNEYSLFIPSAHQSGLKLNHPFTLDAGGLVDLTVDFELGKSVVAPKGLSPDYLFKPVLRIVETNIATVITGSVDRALLEDDTGELSAACADGGIFVYGYPAASGDPDDMGSSTNPPETTEAVVLNNSTGVDEYSYTIGFMSPGIYTLALTCDADLDLAETDEAGDVFTFVQIAEEVELIEGETTIYNFEAEVTP